MSSVLGMFRLSAALGACLLMGGLAASAQSVQHGRNYKPPPAIAHIVVTVEKGFNGKPLSNAAVVFHATKNGSDSGNLEVKTNTDGEATMDLLEAGSHVTIQIIASGYATYAESFDVGEAGKELLVKMERPKEQVSKYVDNDGKAASVEPGTQEYKKPTTAKPADTGAPAATTAPPPVDSPQTTPTSTPDTSTPGTAAGTASSPTGTTTSPSGTPK